MIVTRILLTSGFHVFIRYWRADEVVFSCLPLFVGAEIRFRLVFVRHAGGIVSEKVGYVISAVTESFT